MFSKELSIIIITYRRKDLLKRCLESILKANFKDSYELITVVNGLDTDTLNLLNSFSAKLPNLRFFSIPPTSKGSARNLALKNAQGEILYFIDDDVEMEEKNLQRLTEKFTQNKDIDIIGGPNLTPKESNFFQRCSGYIFSSIFGSVTMRFRYSILPEEKLVDDRYLILCNLAFRKRIFLKEKMDFNRDIASNEENLLLYKLKKKGYNILYCPEIFVYHQRRGNLLLMMKQFFCYGRGRAQMTRIHPISLPWFTVLPCIFFIYLISLLFVRNLFYMGPLMLYLFLNVFFSAGISIKNREFLALPLLMILFPLSHLSYGLGFLFGLIK